MKNLSTTLNLLERLQQQFEKTVEKGPGELFLQPWHKLSSFDDRKDCCHFII